MHRFRGNIWDFDSKPKVMQTLGYPLPMNDRIKEITEARNIELGLGLQLCFLHPSKHKFEHPRFCFERLEYVGQKIQIQLKLENDFMKSLQAEAIESGELEAIKPLPWYPKNLSFHARRLEKTRYLRGTFSCQLLQNKYSLPFAYLC
ncbi:hypothetical protein ARALYDRAFT_912568 [Arabidopsis lyrata subsp. lyrata]|uniref:Uncharacterized protein n=1 Tax=Arabidopsis lyrata subsp. lyrata TaxID=81972 RepID=D7MA20_ARALL|nr:hypothetical protein ARALYDRAFT_912568 [Arabidopsis lyrata subsp. lyrata]